MSDQPSQQGRGEFLLHTVVQSRLPLAILKGCVLDDPYWPGGPVSSRSRRYKLGLAALYFSSRTLPPRRRRSASFKRLSFVSSRLADSIQPR
jgi:hypothetical protein